MRRNLVGIIVLILLSVRVVNAQTVADSIAIVTAPWEVVTVENGIVHKRASIPFLYQGAQSINILEINPRTGKKIGIAFTGQLEKISRIARKHQAIGAINGSYFDMTKGNSVCFLKVGSQVVETKHPRSAICLTEEGKILFVTVDGRSPENAVGINIPELAHLLHVLGGKDALNLDGGGSTALWLSGAPEEGIVNFPCDNRNYDHQGERKVANFLYVH